MWFEIVIFILCVFCLFLVLFSGFIFLFSFKIVKLEKTIKWLFLSRTNLIPPIYEISKDFLTKHEEIFKEIVILRKQEFHAEENNVDFQAFIQIETHLHHELNFIFRACNQHPKLLKEWKFLYVRDLLIDRSISISEKMLLYRNIIKKYQWYRNLYKMLILWLIFPPKEFSDV